MRRDMKQKKGNLIVFLPFPTTHGRILQVEGAWNRIDHFKAFSHKCSEQAALFRARAKNDGTAGAVAAPPTDAYRGAHRALGRPLDHACSSQNP